APLTVDAVHRHARGRPGRAGDDALPGRRARARVRGLLHAGPLRRAGGGAVLAGAGRADRGLLATGRSDLRRRGSPGLTIWIADLQEIHLDFRSHMIKMKAGLKEMELRAEGGWVDIRTTQRWVDLLSEEDLAFLKRFLLASGTLKDLASQYGISYPTVRLRL